MEKTEKFDFEAFESEALEKLRQGKALEGSDGECSTNCVRVLNWCFGTAGPENGEQQGLMHSLPDSFTTESNNIFRIIVKSNRI